MTPCKRHFWQMKIGMGNSWHGFTMILCLKSVVAFCGKMVMFHQGRAVDAIYLDFSKAFSAAKASVSRSIVH